MQSKNRIVDRDRRWQLQDSAKINDTVCDSSTVSWGKLRGWVDEPLNTSASGLFLNQIPSFIFRRRWGSPVRYKALYVVAYFYLITLGKWNRSSVGVFLETSGTIMKKRRVQYITTTSARKRKSARKRSIELFVFCIGAWFKKQDLMDLFGTCG